MRLIFDEEHWVIEGSAGVAVAAYLKERERYAGQNVAIILCGRNVSSKNLIGIL
jgi:threonine dehydratase